MKATTVVRAALVFALGAAVACRDAVVGVCPAILYIKPSLPDTVTIKVGASTIAVAGATYGGCEAGPPPPDFVWRTTDSTVVLVVALDSIHARIQGRRAGRAVVTPAYRTAREAPSAVTVTVVP